MVQKSDPTSEPIPPRKAKPALRTRAGARADTGPAVTKASVRAGKFALHPSLPFVAPTLNESCRQSYVADLSTIRDAIRKGVSARSVEAVAGLLHLPADRMAHLLGIPASTARRKARLDGVLAPDQGERVVGLQRLIGQVQAMVDEGGDPEGFDAGAWTSAWLNEPHPALGGAKPVEYLDTLTGQQILSDLLARNITGAYA